MRKIFKLTVASLILGMSFCATAADKGVIKLGTLGWEDVNSISMVSKKFLESQGYKVQVTTFADWGIAYSALARGDVDTMVTFVNYAAADYWTKNKDKLEKVSNISFGLRQGIVVPAHMPITSIEQLNSVKDQVGGKIIGIEPGSGLMRETQEAIKQYALNYTLVDGSTAAMTAQLQSSTERKQPLVTVLWKPSWMEQKYKVKFLDDPKGVFAPPQAYTVIAKKGFSAQNPKAREALASIFVPIEDVGSISTELKNGKTMDQAVNNWWKTHGELVSKWSVMAK
ncbi:glycine betaine ABC transporter substrate-binding protein [Leeia sp. TBRC 13508]|uniref:Glycine betaine ABC transporter substrate-binding protein n=1 Tax=Leeia speluncae TaxID=2884804 RepID=A0ABS8DA93_9NEIS|nr:glycine betaine ABC transporter substrate-binding protein [Leeia speluncae]MCB6185125.1 glycine betaine ABC transporter substrate-binding protein [Leeia speluncae]